MHFEIIYHCYNVQIQPVPTPVDVPIKVTTPIPTTPKPVTVVTNLFKCPKEAGLFSDPADCSKFYACGNNIAYSMNCGTGMKWNSRYLWCDYPENVQC